MNVKEATALVTRKLVKYLAERFSGKLVFTFHCRDGGVGRLSLTVEQDLTRAELDKLPEQ